MRLWKEEKKRGVYIMTHTNHCSIGTIERFEAIMSVSSFTDCSIRASKRYSVSLCIDKYLQIF